MHMISLNSKIIFIVLFLFNAVAYAQTGYAVRIKAVNISGQCSTAKPVNLQLTRSAYSVNRKLDTGKSSVFGIFVGEYKAVITDTAGKPIETSRLRVRPISCVMPFGCPTFMPETKPKDTMFSAMDFYNTSNDCVNPKTVSIAINGQVLASIAPGTHRRLVVPKGPARMEIIDKTQRLMLTCIDPSIQPYEFYGCTDPHYPKQVKNGVVFSFKNSTETCGKNGGFPVVLWLDGLPVRGLKPKSAAAIAVSKGQHHIRITRNLTGKALFDRAMNCSKSFLFNYGCGKSK